MVGLFCCFVWGKTPPFYMSRFNFKIFVVQLILVSHHSVLSYLIFKELYCIFYSTQPIFLEVIVIPNSITLNWFDFISKNDVSHVTCWRLVSEKNYYVSILYFVAIDVTVSWICDQIKTLHFGSNLFFNNFNIWFQLFIIGFDVVWWFLI